MATIEQIRNFGGNNLIGALGEKYQDDTDFINNFWDNSKFIGADIDEDRFSQEFSLELPEIDATIRCGYIRRVRIVIADFDSGSWAWELF